MVGMLCGCCGGYCSGSTTGSFTDRFSPPFLTQNLPTGDPWSWNAARDNPPGLYINNFEGWQKWGLYSTAQNPWALVNSSGKFHGWRLSTPGSTGSGWPPYWHNESAYESQDECVYSANYRTAKYKSEITVSVPVSKAPVYGTTSYDNRYVTGPFFVFTGPFGTEKDSSLRKIGPRIAIGMRRAESGTGPWYNWYMILDKNSTGSDGNYRVTNSGYADTIIAPKTTYKLGIEIECTNLGSYGLSPGPLFRATCYIDDVQVYQNTYGPFVDTGGAVLGGVNNWRPNGHCRCMVAGRVFGAMLGHPMYQYDFYRNTTTAALTGWATDTTTDFWADNFTFTETTL